MSKALIAMSGGVDSSVAAKLVLDAGFECIGCTMKLNPGDGVDGSFPATGLNHGDGVSGSTGQQCCTLEDTEDARSVAFKLGMPFYAFNFKDEFREKVIDQFVDCYLSGHTPNPCIECNRCLKFGKLLERARVLGCDCVVTGHYARIEERDGEMVLLKGLDEKKDQSYVLYMLSQEQLKHIRFPLGGLTKAEVRRIADENGFINASKPDSQDICFVPDGDYAAVVERYLQDTRGSDNDKNGRPTENKNIENKAQWRRGTTPGNFVDMNGKVLGRHKGIIHYTIGQRKGLGISAEHPLYVHHIDVENNEVVLSDNESLFSRTACVDKLYLTTEKKLPDEYRCSAKIRYHHKEQPGTLYFTGEGCRFEFDEPQRAITPGQSLVLYEGDRVLGGGVIVAGKRKGDDSL